MQRNKFMAHKIWTRGHEYLSKIPWLENNWKKEGKRQMVIYIKWVYLLMVVSATHMHEQWPQDPCMGCAPHDHTKMSMIDEGAHHTTSPTDNVCMRLQSPPVVRKTLPYILRTIYAKNFLTWKKSLYLMKSKRG